jgi:PAS domain S-box-containing protein
MKNRIQPTQHEKNMPEDAFIVSKTDTKGRITYGNRIFMELSGYSEEELLNTQHNIIRHPDMPRSVFHLLWETVKGGQEFNGYVKNLSKDGSFYWVFANVTPSYAADGSLLGYYSVRRKPNREAVVFFEKVYKDMLLAEQQAGAKKAIETSTAILSDLLNSKGVSFDEFVLSF